MRTLIPVEHHAQVAVAVVVKAQLPEVPAVRSESAALVGQAVVARNV